MLINRWNRIYSFVVEGEERGEGGGERQKLVTQLTAISKSHKLCCAAQELKSHVVYATKGLS